MDTALGLLAVGVLVLATACFVAAEFAMIAVDRDRVDALAERGDKRARGARTMLSRLSFNLSGAQLGITVTSLVLGFIAEPTVAQVLEPAVRFLPAGIETGVSVAIALVLVTVATMVIGELIPKGYAVSKPLEAAFRLAPAVRVYGLVFGPLIRLLNAAADWSVRRLGIEPRGELRFVRTIEELSLLIESSGEEGTLDPTAFTLLARTIRFGNKTAADALVPRVDMVSIGTAASLDELAVLAVETGHSRFPVVGEGTDDIVGIAHAKDVLLIEPDRRGSTPVTDISRIPLFIPEGRDLESLLTEMRHGTEQLAVVVDEYGGVAGVVSIEDIVEEIVGHIEDEHDQAPPLTQSLPEGTSVVEASLHDDEVREVTGFEMPEGPYETLAGFLLARLGHLPVPGERVDVAGWVFEVMRMDRRRIASVRVTRPRGSGT